MADSFDVGEESQDGSEDDKILEEAKARFKIVEEAEHELRQDALDDEEFAAGDQWPDDIKADRDRDRRPCLTINKLPQHIKQITNDQRQNRPSIKVHAVDDKADVETAKIFSGLIRHIEYNSNADAAYDTAFEKAVRSGRGFFRVITDYVSPLSFDQEILIKRIKNPFSVFFDPFSTEPDGSDANFAFITEDVSKDDFIKRYPKSKLASSGEWESVGNSAPGWMGDKSARVAEYFYKDFKTETIVLLSNGEVGLKKDLVKLPPDVTIVAERETQIPVIKWCKHTAFEILEKREWLGIYIPIIPVYGEELDIDGKRILKGIVRDAKDPQRMLNFWKSAETEAIALAPKTPFIAEEGQLEGYEADWQTANTRNHAFLKYRAKSIGGHPVPPPQRQAFEPAVQAITQAAMFAADDIKGSTGIHDSTLGARSNETSGVAIQRRNNQAQTSNFHFVDNLTRSIRHLGRVIIDLIPKIYDTARAARIIGEEGEHEVIRINQEFEHKGKLVSYDLSKGKYDVTVDVGPSYASKRQEAVASMIEITRANPKVMDVAGDLMVKNMDWPGSQEVAERIKKTLPPGLADDPNKKSPLPPEAQAQMQQMGGMIEQLTAKLNELQSEKEQKLLELESKERIEMAKLETQAAIELAKLESKEAITQLNAQITDLQRRQDLLRAQVPIQFEEDSQENFAQPLDGGMPADVEPEQIDPIGGESPSTPMEGINHDDPNAY